MNSVPPQQRNLLPKTRYVISLLIGGAIIDSVLLYTLRNILSENALWLAWYFIDVVYLIIVITVLRTKKINLFESKIESPRTTFLKTGALMFLSLVFALGTISLLSLLLPDIYSDAEEFNVVKFDPLYIAIAGFLSVVVLAPLWEEITFRGIILNRWTEKWSTTRAILLSSFLFALFHPLDIIGAFIFSIILSIQYLNTKNLLIAIVGHSFYNLVLFILFVSGSLAGWGEKPLEIPSTSETVLFGSICIAISLPILAYWLKKNWPKFT